MTLFMNDPLVNLYLFMRVFLAVIYNSYKGNLRLEVEASLKLKRDLLRKSFECLAPHESNHVQHLSKALCPLSKALYNVSPLHFPIQISFHLRITRPHSLNIS